MKYLKCICGLPTFITEIQKSCHNCGRNLDYETLEKSTGLQKATGMNYFPFLKITPAHLKKYDMNQWVEQEKHTKKRNGWAS